ncbi:hypothetical protein V6D40_01455 [Corynebacterium sp. Q4381]|uniref:cupredoxin domain-containing protein n=1 Tax=Corynebacterium sp. Marseille-Q4381 TaxID=3121597 RepID=UPI002FE69C91
MTQPSPSHTMQSKKASHRNGAVAWAVVALLAVGAVGGTLLVDSSGPGPVRGQVIQDVRINGMSFEPASVVVDSSTPVVLRITNDDDREHNLKLGDGFSGPIHPNDTVIFDFGTFEASEQGWCAKAGHKSMGMVYDVIVQ